MSLKEELEPLSPSVIDRLKGKGMSQSEIARLYGYTRQYISWIKYYHGGKLTPREEVMQHFPFVVTGLMSQCMPYKRLRDHGEFRWTGGVGMSDDKLKRLLSFYERLRDENAVVEFDPNIPPIPGVSSKGGWAFRPRVPADEDLLIRVNEFADLTDQGRLIWRFPPKDPEL